MEVWKSEKPKHQCDECEIYWKQVIRIGGELMQTSICLNCINDAQSKLRAKKNQPPVFKDAQ